MNLITKLALIVSCQNLLAESHDYDLVIYGGTSAGVTTAVQAKKMGKTAIIVGPDKHLGGLSSGGLGWTDTGKKEVIGGLSREFYHRVFKHYDTKEAWKWQKKEQYGNKGQGNRAMDGEERTMWIFEPSVAEKIFEDFVREYKIPVHRDEWLDREKGVTLKDGNIASITMLSGKTYTGRMFIDATYEGDLMAAAGVDYHVGRESQDHYKEKWAGVQTGVLHHRHHFGFIKKKISPYKIPGDPKSGVLPRINPNHPGEFGAADKGIQAYCFRMCLTNHPENRIPFPKPEGYDPSQYQLLTRIFDAGWRETFHKFDPIPNYKTDTNNHGPMSTDNIGYNHDYPEASYERRKEIIKEHETYQKGWLYFIANDPSVPEDVQKKMQTWGLPKDEFKDNGNWSHQLYIREARRMVGSYVMTENELMKRRPTPQSVGMGSYTMDSHNIQRYITPEGYVQNEGDIGAHLKGPYEIAYGSLVPKKGQCGNLLVPVCVSSSHIAFGSIRMEPVFMILGQSAATAAVIAIDRKIDVQSVPYEELKAQLIKSGQILGASMAIKKKIVPVEIKHLPGIVIDDTKARLTGNWTNSTATSGFLGTGYHHDGDKRDGKLTATFTAKIPKDGKYEIFVSAPPNKNRASNAKVTIQHAKGTTTAKVSLRHPAKNGNNLHSAGVYEFKQGRTASVTLSNEGADGYLIADAVQWLPTATSPSTKKESKAP